MKRSRSFFAAVPPAVIGALLAVPMAVHADMSYSLPSDRIQYDEEGNAYCLDGEERLTGRFSLEPDFLMGDLTGDALVDASDAASLLVAAAAAGTSGTSAEDFLCAENDTFTDTRTAALFADVDGNGIVDASDAAAILVYCAENGTGVSYKLGYAEFFADEEGCLQKGFIVDAETGNTYFADDSYQLCNGWITVDSKRYYLDADGILQTQCWISYSGNDYYLQEDGSVLCNDWIVFDDKTYYLGEDGASVRGLAEIAGKTYYFTDDGLATGWITISGNSYYFDEDGCMHTGWLSIGEDTYYFDAQGIRQTGLTEIDGNTYFFYAINGKMAKGATYAEGKMRYFADNGIMMTGWYEIGDSRYYSLEDGTCCTGLQTIDGNLYYFNSLDRSMTANAWVDLTDGWRYFGADGISVTGILEIDGKTYYLNENGIRQTGWQTVGDSQYYFTEEGYLATGWTVIGASTYYFGENGKPVTGWKEIDGDNYYFDANGAMLIDQEMDGLYLESDGKAVSILYHNNKLKAQAAFAQNGTSVSGIYNYVRATTRYKKTEATKTLAQIESLGWLYFVDYSMKNYYGVCYYLAAKMDFLLTEAGYECRIVHATHGSGDHYWNQVNINGEWMNYDLTNGLNGYTWSQMIAYGNYTFLGYVRPEYK